jgi:hypothetical protein
VPFDFLSTDPKAEPMSATSPATPDRAPSGGREEQGGMLDRAELGGARLLFVDARIRSHLMAEARRGAITRVFAVPRADQSFLVTMILIGAVGTVLRDLAGRAVPHPSRTDAAMGGSVLSAAVSGLAGAPSRNMPLAGAVIAFAVLSHSIRPAVVGSAREIGALAHSVGAAFRGRYGH